MGGSLLRCSLIEAVKNDPGYLDIYEPTERWRAGAGVGGNVSSRLLSSDGRS